jgi:hypothetical protein
MKEGRLAEPALQFEQHVDARRSERRGRDAAGWRFDDGAGGCRRAGGRQGPQATRKQAIDLQVGYSCGAAKRDGAMGVGTSGNQIRVSDEDRSLSYPATWFQAHRTSVLIT